MKVATEPVPLTAVIERAEPGVAPLIGPVNVAVKVRLDPSIVGFVGSAITEIDGVDRAAVAVTVAGEEIFNM